MSDYFIFDDIDTRDYEGILVYFNEVDTTPKRVGEFIQIPNRNGSFFLDGGRYEDATHTYDIVALSKEYASDLINALASKVGYFRLQDSFNTDEFYSAVFNSEIEPKITKERDKLTFKVTFTRKPQRWLTSGETEVAVDSGDTLTNPTLFESSPLLEIEGTGDIEFNGYTVSIESSDIGKITLPCTKSGNTYSLDGVNQLNAGDPITVSGFKLTFKRTYLTADAYLSHATVISCTGLDGTGYSTYVKAGTSSSRPTKSIDDSYIFPDITLEYGTPYQVVIDGRVRAFFSGGGAGNYILGEKVTIIYDGDDSFSFTTQQIDDLAAPSPWHYGVIVTNPAITAYSTKPYDYGTIYCDTDIGEFYRIEGGEYISMNHVGDLGSDLPTLAPGTNTVTYDNTITELNIIPRWWKI